MSAHGSFGKYVLLRKLATGGMGEIFLAKQVGPSGFEKLLVIKRILAHHHDKNDYLDMFLSEAKLVARLTHNNIIQIHEMGQIDGDYFIAMEYVRGKSLRDIIDKLRAKGAQMPVAYVLDLAIKLCDGLDYAHGAQDLRGRAMNIIHRDVNPHNVLISYSGDLKLIDFGIAKSEMASVNTATGTIKGKFVYMSPEQSAADPIDSRSDIFSLGIVLYELATLENPFVRQNVVLSLEAIQRHDVEPPETKRKDVGALTPLLQKALSKDPDDRYQNCLELREDLRALFRSGDVSPEEEDIEVYLNQLFADDIREEDTLLAEADSATSPPKSASNRPSGISYSFAEEDDSDITRSGRLPTGKPRLITSKPFSDDEVTMSGDEERLAARSRRQSEISRASSEDIEETPTPALADFDSEDPDTRSERIPSEVRQWGDSNYRIANSTADMPANSVLRESTPPIAAGLFQEPLSQVESLLSARNEETREIRKGSMASLLEKNGKSLLLESSGNMLKTYPAEFDIEREPSVSLPVYVGKWRRTMFISAVVLFCLTVAVGYWATLKLAKNKGPRTKTVLNAAPERAQPKLNLVPAPDPVFNPQDDNAQKTKGQERKQKLLDSPDSNKSAKTSKKPTISNPAKDSSSSSKEIEIETEESKAIESSLRKIAKKTE